MVLLSEAVVVVLTLVTPVFRFLFIFFKPFWRNFGSAQPFFATRGIRPAYFTQWGRDKVSLQT